MKYLFTALVTLVFAAGVFGQSAKDEKEVRAAVTAFYTALITLVSVAGIFGQSAKDEKDVRATVTAFYTAFNSHGFDRAADFTTADWNHINPFGGRTNGREAVLAELREVHSSFLKGTKDTVKDMDVRFGNPHSAAVTVTSQMSTFTTPDGVKHENERQIRTFLVVKQKNKWLIMQDQNTLIRSLAGQ